MRTSAQPKSNLMGRSEELIYRLEGAEVLFEAEVASLLLRIGAGQQQASGSNERQQQVLVERQLILTASKETKTWMEPMREYGCDLFDAFGYERIGRVPPRISLSRIAAGRQYGCDPLVEGGGDHGLLGVSRVTTDSNIAMIDLRQSIKV